METRRSVGDLSGQTVRRLATSQEKANHRFWDDAYAHGLAPWEIGGPQPAFTRLIIDGTITGRVLEVGCGTGEVALLAASIGLDVTAIDIADRALEKAKASASERSLTVDFRHASALDATQLTGNFDVVLDCGLFHTLIDGERIAYADSLASVTRSGGRLWLLCFGDEGYDLGPRPVSQTELHSIFNEEHGWAIERIAFKRILTNDHPQTGYPAWMAAITRM